MGLWQNCIKAFSSLLAPLILRMFDNSREAGSQTNSLYQGNIALLLKKDWGPMNVSFCGPVSLLPFEKKVILPNSITQTRHGLSQNVTYTLT